MPVTVLIEVVRFNVLPSMGLVVNALGWGEPRPWLPVGPLLPGEEPADAVVRILHEKTGISRVFHEPLPLMFRRYEDQQAPGPTLTLPFALLGPVSSEPNSTTTYVTVADLMDDRGRGRIDHPDVVIEARHAVRRLLESTSVALHMLKDDGVVPEAFTLAELRRLYTAVYGEEVRIDSANFRRKVEAAHGFVEKVAAPGRPRHKGRPPQWYRSGGASQLEPPIRFGTTLAGS